MTECIICRTEKDDLTDEHVIPRSLGGHYHIYTVCKVCNNKLGGKIDDPLVNHWFSDFVRDDLSIKGYSGKIPDPLAGDCTLADHPEKKFKLYRDDNGQYVPRLLYSPPEKTENGWAFSVDASKSREKIEELKRKVTKQIAKKEGVSINRIEFKEEEIRCYESPWMQISKKIDLHQFKLGLLKIGYEFAVDSIPEYYNDPSAIEISQFLLNVSNCSETQLCDELYEKIGQFVKGTGFDYIDSSSNPFSEILDFDGKKHYLTLFDTPEGLVCFINLYKLFSVMIVLSKKQHLQDDIIFVVNDLGTEHTEKFKKLHIIDVAHEIYENYFQLGYFFNNEEEVKKFYMLQKSPDFEIENLNGDVVFFNSDGSLSGKKLSDIEAKLNQEDIDLNTDEIEIQIDEILFVKALPLNQLFMVNAVKFGRTQVKKL
jgi:predicted amino acid-binding ACT domain protein